jgi:hypothetical protein
MDDSSNKAKLLNGVVSIAPKKYIDVLLVLYRNLEGKNIEWAVGGDLGENLRTVNVEPDCIEIYTSEDGAERIVEATSEFNPHSVALETQQLPRNAVIETKDYPIYVRSYYSEFIIGAVRVKVYGDAQYRLGDWDWGDKLEFNPEFVYVVGKKTAVVPLSLKCEFYQSLGWADRAEKIRETLYRQRRHGR